MRSVADFRAWAARQWRADWPHWLARRRRRRGRRRRPGSVALLHPPTEAVMADNPEAVAVGARLAASGVGRWAWRCGGSSGCGVPTASNGCPSARPGRRRRWRSSPERPTRGSGRWTPRRRSRRRGPTSISPRPSRPRRGNWRPFPSPTWCGCWPFWRGSPPTRRPGSGSVSCRWSASTPNGSNSTGGSSSSCRTPSPVCPAAVCTAQPSGSASGCSTPRSVADAVDFSADLQGLRRLTVTPRRVLVCENATTVGTLPSLPSTVAVHGMGFAAPVLTEVGWVREADCWYWGDLDTYGFQILGQLRAAAPSVTSVLMDAATWCRTSDCVSTRRGRSAARSATHRWRAGRTRPGADRGQTPRAGAGTCPAPGRARGLGSGLHGRPGPGPLVAAGPGRAGLTVDTPARGRMVT